MAENWQGNNLLYGKENDVFYKKNNELSKMQIGQMAFWMV